LPREVNRPEAQRHIFFPVSLGVLIFSFIMFGLGSILLI